MRKPEADGWFLVRAAGSHHVFRHKAKAGRVVIVHPRKDCPLGTLKAIERQAGITLR